MDLGAVVAAADPHEGGGEIGQRAQGAPDDQPHQGRAEDERSGQHAHQIEELLTSQPPPTADELVLHHRDVHRGPTERGDAEAKEGQREISHVAKGCTARVRAR